MADDRLPCCRSESIVATRSDNVMSRPPAISLRTFQKGSSRLTLVLCPAMTMERLTTGDFIARPPLRCGGGRGRAAPWHCVTLRGRARLCCVRAVVGWPPLFVHPPPPPPAPAPLGGVPCTPSSSPEWAVWGEERPPAAG